MTISSLDTSTCASTTAFMDEDRTCWNFFGKGFIWKKATFLHRSTIRCRPFVFGANTGAEVSLQLQLYLRRLQNLFPPNMNFWPDKIFFHQYIGLHMVQNPQHKILYHHQYSHQSKQVLTNSTRMEFQKKLHALLLPAAVIVQLFPGTPGTKMDQLYLVARTVSSTKRTFSIASCWFVLAFISMRTQVLIRIYTFISTRLRFFNTFVGHITIFNIVFVQTFSIASVRTISIRWYIYTRVRIRTPGHTDWLAKVIIANL